MQHETKEFLKGLAIIAMTAVFFAVTIIFVVCK